MELKQILKLSTDIINVIIKYNDFSIENMKKKLSKYTNIPIKGKFKLKSYITFDDILMKCMVDGNIGFFIHTAYKSLINEFDKLPKRNNIIVHISDNCKQYYLDFLEYSKLCDVIKFHELFDLIDY